MIRDREVVVFVEVRYRKGGAFGGALASVTLAKRRRIVSAAHIWLTGRPLDARRPCRFDVVGFEGDRIEWVRGAFET